LTLLTAADLGMTKLHCALPPLANGTSHTNALQLVRNLRARGHSVSVDTEAMEAASRSLAREAALFDLPSGAPVEYDEAYYQHTLPGGVLTTTRRQLAELGKAELMPKVVEEAVRVRADLGWPIVVTPFAQYIVTQASINVITGERYSRITDEVVDFVLGEFGEAPGEIDPDLRDRVLQTPRGRAGLKPQDETGIDGFRAKLGPALSDEELLLRAVMPKDQVEAMLERKARAADPLAGLLDALDGAASMSVNIRTEGRMFSAAGAGTAGGSRG
jgi:oxaloacetate decarboxylase alpha subunit